jgi:hypothetical protein
MSVYKINDQFYTKPDIAKKCFDDFKTFIAKTDLNLKKYHFIEPSAGCGCFYQALPKNNRTGIDIDPLKCIGIEHEGIIKHDFLTWTPQNKQKNIVIGNPPFGHRSKMAIKFFNHATTMADIIAFIVPRQFKKYSVHSQLNEDFKLIRDFELDDNAFYTPDGKEKKVRCNFQIWTRLETKQKNLRILTPPPTKHRDFEMYQYNNTLGALKFFEKEWDFAVPRQGYENYNRRETKPEKCEKNKQWIMFKTPNNDIKNRLFNLDFVRLARKNTTIFGFGKADVVEEYQKLYD